MEKRSGTSSLREIGSIQTGQDQTVLQGLVIGRLQEQISLLGPTVAQSPLG